MGKTRKDRRGKSKAIDKIESYCAESKEIRHLMEKVRLEFFSDIRHYVYNPTLQDYDKLNALIELKKANLDRIIELYNSLTTEMLGGKDFHKCWELPEELHLAQLNCSEENGGKYGVWNPNNDSQKVPFLFSDGFLAKLGRAPKAKIHHAYRQKLHLSFKKKSHSIDHIASTFYIAAPFTDPKKKALIKRCISWPAKHDKHGNEVEIEDQGSYEIKLVIDPTNTTNTHFFDFIRYDHNPESVHSNKMDINNNLSRYPVQLLENGCPSHLHINTQLFQALFPKKIASPEAIKIHTHGLNYMSMINVLDFAFGIQHTKPLLHNNEGKQYKKSETDLPPSLDGTISHEDIIARFEEIAAKYKDSTTDFDEKVYLDILKRDYPEIAASKGNRLIKAIMGRVAYGIDYCITHPKHQVTSDKCHIGDLVDDRFVSIIPTPSQLYATKEYEGNGKNN